MKPTAFLEYYGSLWVPDKIYLHTIEEAQSIKPTNGIHYAGNFSRPLDVDAAPALMECLFGPSILSGVNTNLTNFCARYPLGSVSSEIRDSLRLKNINVLHTVAGECPIDGNKLLYEGNVATIYQLVVVRTLMAHIEGAAQAAHKQPESTKAVYIKHCLDQIEYLWAYRHQVTVSLLGSLVSNDCAVVARIDWPMPGLTSTTLNYTQHEGFLGLAPEDLDKYF
jgi:hypothetical protein